MISRALLALVLVAACAAGQTKLPGGVLRYDRPGATSPSFWQYIQQEWGWVVSSRPFGRSIAFLVGVGNYQYIEPKLRYVADDLQEMREFLLGSAGFDTVYVVQDASDVNLVEDYMSNEFPASLRAEDRLLFYFTGHGADRAGTGYMQFSKAQPGRYDASQYLDVTRCERWSRQIPARHILFLIDACNSGLGYDAKPGDAPRVDEDLLNLFSGDGSRIVITAGTGNEKSFQVDEGNKGGYSVFTRAFLDAIRHTQSPSGFLILDEVMAGLRRNVAAFSRGNPARQMTPRLWQIPRATGKDKGSFVFLNPKAKAPPVPSPLKQYVKVTPKERIADLNGSPPPDVGQRLDRFGSQYVLIPKGTFLMGCSDKTEQCKAGGDEVPAHQVTLSRDFYLGQTEVTRESYLKFVNQTKRKAPEQPEESKSDQDPIVRVHLLDAQAYCAFVGGRLPTEAEWEYAARGGSQGARYGTLDDIAWFSKNSGKQIHPVGQKKPNVYGLYDMLGNVFEWTADGWDGYKPQPVTDPQNHGTEFVVIRGGSWNIGAEGVRSAYRFVGLQPSDDVEVLGSTVHVGFRCVLGRETFPQ